MISVYLAGPIQGKSDEECRVWRDEAATRLRASGIRSIDPMDHDFRGIEQENAGRIVAQDKALIQEADCLLVCAVEPGWGTAMEVFYAFSLGKRVVAFTGASQVSPWLTLHAHALFDSLEKAIDDITSQ